MLLIILLNMCFKHSRTYAYTCLKDFIKGLPGPKPGKDGYLIHRQIGLGGICQQFFRSFDALFVDEVRKCGVQMLLEQMM